MTGANYEFPKAEALGRLVNQELDPMPKIGIRQRARTSECVGGAEARRRKWIDNGPAANSDHRGEPSNDEAISWHEQDVSLEHKARFFRFSRLNLRTSIEQPDLGEYFRRTRVKVYRGSILQSFCVGEQFQSAIGGSRRPKAIWFDEDGPAPNFLEVDTCQIDCRALTSAGLFRRCTVHLHSANARLFARWLNGDSRLAPDDAAGYRSCNDRSKSRHGECTVNGQSEVPRIVALRNSGTDIDQGSAKIVEPCSSDCTDSNDRSTFEKRTFNKVLNLETNQFGDLRVGSINLCQSDKTMSNLQKLADFEVLAGLWTNAFVGRYYQDHEVDSRDPGQHVSDEPLVAGYVYESDLQIRVQFQVREPKVY